MQQKCTSSLSLWNLYVPYIWVHILGQEARKSKGRRIFISAINISICNLLSEKFRNVTELCNSVKAMTAAWRSTRTVSYFHDLTGLMEGCCCFFYLKAVPMVSSSVLFCLESCIHIATFVREGGRKWQLNEQTGCRERGGSAEANRKLILH